MTTWDDARVATLRQAQDDRGGALDGLVVHPAGLETPAGFWLTLEAQEHLDDPDGMAFLLDPPHYWVAKATGRAVQVPWPDAVEARESPDARRVGDWTVEP